MAEIMPFSAAPHKYKEKQSFRVEKMLMIVSNDVWKNESNK